VDLLGIAPPGGPELQGGGGATAQPPAASASPPLDPPHHPTAPLAPAAVSNIYDDQCDKIQHAQLCCCSGLPLLHFGPMETAEQLEDAEPEEAQLPTR